MQTEKNKIKINIEEQIRIKEKKLEQDKPTKKMKEKIKWRNIEKTKDSSKKGNI